MPKLIKFASSFLCMPTKNCFYIQFKCSERWSRKQIKFAAVDRKKTSETFSAVTLSFTRYLKVRGWFGVCATCFIVACANEIRDQGDRMWKGNLMKGTFWRERRRGAVYIFATRKGSKALMKRWSGRSFWTKWMLLIKDSRRNFHVDGNIRKLFSNPKAC
jgi:hypothetical protein